MKFFTDEELQKSYTKSRTSFMYFLFSKEKAKGVPNNLQLDFNEYLEKLLKKNFKESCKYGKQKTLDAFANSSKEKKMLFLLFLKFKLQKQKTKKLAEELLKVRQELANKRKSVSNKVWLVFGIFASCVSVTAGMMRIVNYYIKFRKLFWV